MNAEYEQMTFPELVDHLEDLDGRRTPVGWTPEDAVRRASIERCIIGMIAGEHPDRDSWMPCEMEIRLRTAEREVPAVIRGMGVGGLVVATEETDWIAGTHVEMQIRQSASDEHGLRIRGILRGIEGRVLRISVSEQPSEAHERRLRRFVLELLRHRVHN